MFSFSLTLPLTLRMWKLTHKYFLSSSVLQYIFNKYSYLKKTRKYWIFLNLSSMFSFFSFKQKIWSKKKFSTVLCLYNSTKINSVYLCTTSLLIIHRLVRIRSKKNFTNNICFNPFFFSVSFTKILKWKKYCYINIFYVLRPTFLQRWFFLNFSLFYILIPTEKCCR